MTLKTIDTDGLDKSLERLAVMASTFPAMRPKESEWLKFIGIASRMNTSEMDKSIAGRCLANGMAHSPFETISMIRDMYLDNPTLTEQIIGPNNVKLLQ